MQRRARSLKTPDKRRSTAKQDRRDAKGLRFCIPHENDEQFDCIMYHFDRLLVSPMRLPAKVRYSSKEPFSRLKRGKPPKYFQLLRRSSKKKPSLYPSKTATLKRLLVFTVPDSGEDTCDFLNWYISTDPVLNTVYRGGDPAIRTYVYTKKGIGANYVKPRALRREELPAADAALLLRRSCQVWPAAYLTRVETVSDDWKDAMKGLSRKETTQKLCDSPDLRQHDVRVEEELRGWYVGGEDTEYDNKDAAKARAEELRKDNAQAEADAPSRSEKVLGAAQLAAKETSKAAVEEEADAEEVQEQSLHFLKIGVKATKKRKEITRKEADSKELMEEKKEATLQKRQQKLAEAEAALAADPTNTALKKKVSVARRDVKQQERVVQHAKAERKEAAMRAKDAKKHDDDKRRSFESAQVMTPAAWAVHKKEERLAAIKSAQEECEAMAPGKKSNAYLTLGEMPAMGLLPHETRFLG